MDQLDQDLFQSILSKDIGNQLSFHIYLDRLLGNINRRFSDKANETACCPIHFNPAELPREEFLSSYGLSKETQVLTAFYGRELQLNTMVFFTSPLMANIGEESFQKGIVQRKGIVDVPMELSKPPSLQDYASQ